MQLAVLDTYTLMNLLGFGYLLVLVFLLAYHRVRTVKHRALVFFMVSRLLFGIGWTLILHRGQWPHPLTVYGGNIALFFGMAAEGIAFITHRRRYRRVERMFLSTAAAGSVVFLFFAHSPTQIVGVGAVVGVLLSGATTMFLLKRSHETVLVRFVGILYGVLTLSFAIRAVYGFRGVLDISVTQAVVQSIFFLPVIAILLAGSTAMVLLLKEQDEQALQESYEKYDTLFRSNLSAVFLSDPETGEVLEANPQALSLTGYHPHEIQGRTFTELGLWPPGERERAKQLYGDQGQLVNHEARAYTRNGEERTWLVSSGSAHLRGRPVLATTILDISNRKAMEERIHGLLAEKDLLLREVHHRVRNNFTQISSVLSMQAHRSSDEHATATLEDAVNRIAAMLALYDQVYTMGEESRVRVRDYFDRLIERLRAAFPASEHISVTLKIDDIEISPRVVSPLGQIVNELFTNSIKHAFQNRSEGNIHVALNYVVADAVLLLEYEDDGPGSLPAPRLAQPAESAPREGFGTVLIHALASQLNATWKIEPPPGTHYWFRFDPES